MFDQSQVEAALGYQFNNEQWLRQALCHKSYSKENPDWAHNEKLEFLGDAVLDLVISDLLMEQFKDDSEGSLSRKRAALVNEDSLFQLTRRLGLDQFILIGEREANNNLRGNSRIVASVFEAIVGGLYRDAGFDVTFNWVKEQFTSVLADEFSHHDFEKDYKTRFQEWVQEVHKTTPVYKVVSVDGPDHDRTFQVEVFVNEKSWGSAVGSSKKSAAQNAAQRALEKVNS